MTTGGAPVPLHAHDTHAMEDGHTDVTHLRGRGAGCVDSQPEWNIFQCSSDIQLFGTCPAGPGTG
jgi:hypothetical protein